MRNLKEFPEIFLYRDYVDMRKDISGLGFIAQRDLSADWSKPQLFVFLNKKKDLMKILYFDRTGFAVWKKRLETERFPWLKKSENAISCSLSLKEFESLLSGINIFSKHVERVYDSIV